MSEAHAAAGRTRAPGDRLENASFPGSVQDAGNAPVIARLHSGAHSLDGLRDIMNPKHCLRGSFNLPTLHPRPPGANLLRAMRRGPWVVALRREPAENDSAVATPPGLGPSLVRSGA